MANAPPVRGYPILVRLDGRLCLVVGGGKVATRKCEGLLEAGAAVTVISPAVTERLGTLAEAGTITWDRRAYTPGVIAAYRPILVFAATSDPAVNQQVVYEAHSSGCLVDSVDENASQSDFSSMPAVRRGPIAVAIGTGGGSPALAQTLKKRIEAAVGPEYGQLAEWLAELRPRVRESVSDPADRQRLWQAVLESDVLDLIRQGDEQAARARIETIVGRVSGQQQP